jgi:hypothetical protein
VRTQTREIEAHRRAINLQEGSAIMLERAHRPGRSQNARHRADHARAKPWDARAELELLERHRPHRPIGHHDGADRAPRRQLPGHHPTQLMPPRWPYRSQNCPTRRSWDLQLDIGPSWREQPFTHADNIDRRRVKGREPDLRLHRSGSTGDGWWLRDGPCHRTRVRRGRGRRRHRRHQPDHA